MGKSKDTYSLLVADSDKDYLQKSTDRLRGADYNVVAVSDGSEVIDKALKHQPDLILLEMDLDEVDGIEICSELKSNAQFLRVPIVFLTEKDDIYGQIAAYESGADAYILKPIKKRLLLAQVKAILRRAYELDEDQVLIHKFGDIVIDEDAVVVYKKEEPINLSKKEFELLLLLVSKPGKVFRRPVILKRIWGDNIIVGDRNIDTHIKKLRKKLGKSYIQTSRGMGYKFNFK